ncbi:MAG: thioredoxin family protein [bacterium]
MVLTESASVEPGKVMPSFELLDSYGHSFSLDSIKGRLGTIILFTCNHCPYAEALWTRFIELAFDVTSKGVNSLAINPNINDDYPEDSVLNMKRKSTSLKLRFPYLVDDKQEIAKLYSAQCTPDIYLLDADNRLFYHGQFDDCWQDRARVKHHSLREAVTALISSNPINFYVKPSLGCSIKWV